MPTIDSKSVTVLIVCDTDPESFDAALSHAKAAMPIFAKQPGFVSASLHAGEKRNRFVQYLQWKTLDDHVACQSAADWQAPEGMAFWGLIKAGAMTIDPQVYAIESIID